jgi:GAF domain-containing protein
MITPAEQKRLHELYRYQVLDSLPQQAIDRLVGYVARSFDVPIVLVSLMDLERQWFMARHGLDETVSLRAISFCDHVITSEEIMVVEDARLDPRFACNPLVTGGIKIRAYAGAPLVTPHGYIIGTVCVVDNERPRRFTPQQLSLLEVASASVMAHLEARHAHMIAATAMARAEAAQEARVRFISQVTHDLRGPMSAIQGYSELIEESVETGTLLEIAEDISIIKQANAELDKKLSAIAKAEHEGLA